MNGIIKISEIPKGSAVAVTPVGITEVRENDEVLLAIKCWIDKEGNAIPVNERMQYLKKELNTEIGNDVFLIKKSKSTSI